MTPDHAIQRARKAMALAQGCVDADQRQEHVDQQRTTRLIQRLTTGPNTSQPRIPTSIQRIK